MAKDSKTSAKTTKESSEKTTAKAAPAKAASSKTASAKTASAKSGGAEGAPRKANAALMKPMTPSKELGAVVGAKPLPRTEVVSKVWEYIKSHKLQNPKNGREILADDKLQKVFGTDKVTMFEMNKHLSKHLS